MQTEQQIIRIKHLLNNKSLSFIIGAGFSKNMSNKFFDWGDLLKPIITEMYHIDDEKEIEHKIEEIGYLGIAQEYVRRKGFHEAIDVYIEQHTPTISIKENSDEPEYIVTLNNEFIESADVTCHRLLFNLDVKHIYTFKNSSINSHFLIQTVRFIGLNTTNLRHSLSILIFKVPLSVVSMLILLNIRYSQITSHFLHIIQNTLV